MSTSNLSIKEYKEREDREEKGHLNKGSADATDLFLCDYVCTLISLYLSNKSGNNGKNNDNSRLLRSIYYVGECCSKHLTYVNYLIFIQVYDVGTTAPILRPRKRMCGEYKVICSRVHNLHVIEPFSNPAVSAS